APLPEWSFGPDYMLDSPFPPTLLLMSKASRAGPVDWNVASGGSRRISAPAIVAGRSNPLLRAHWASGRFRPRPGAAKQSARLEQPHQPALQDGPHADRSAPVVSPVLPAAAIGVNA